MSSASEQERLARATVSLVCEPGDVRALGLTRQLGGPGFLEVLREHPDLRESFAAAAGRLADADPERELARAAARGIRFVVPGDDEWPARLDDLADAGALHERGGVPAGLWVRGPRRLDELGDALAVVGARSSTSYGDQVASEIAAGVAAEGHPVVSGGAAGIDYAAHRGAVSAGGLTVAVLACGVDRAYPAANRAMFEHLAEHHLIVAESPPGASPMRIRFLSRNRLIAALTGGTVVVEAALRSGALNTTSWADLLSRPVMGVPGPVTSAASEGVHQLVRAGGAQLVTSAGDVLEMVGTAGEHLLEVPRAPGGPRDRLSHLERQVLDAVPVARPAATASVARVAALQPDSVHDVLEGLVRAGFVEKVPTGWRLALEVR